MPCEFVRQQNPDPLKRKLLLREEEMAQARFDPRSTAGVIDGHLPSLVTTFPQNRFVEIPGCIG